MGKKACLALDLGYDPWTDEYHDGDDELYDCYSTATAAAEDYNYICRNENNSQAFKKYDEAVITGRGTSTSSSCVNYAQHQQQVSDANNNNAASSKPSNKHDNPSTPASVLARGCTSSADNTQQSNSTLLTVVLPPPKKMPSTRDTAARVAFNNNTKTTKSVQILHYVPNPHRRPLFAEYIAHDNGLLVHVVFFLNLEEVLTLAMVSKLLQESLSVDGLYCSSGSSSNSSITGDGCRYHDDTTSNGMLLPCLHSHSHRLLPLLDNNPSATTSAPPAETSSAAVERKKKKRPRGIISRIFAYECLAFSASHKALFATDHRIRTTSSSQQLASSSVEITKCTFQPRTIWSMNNASEQQINAISFRRVRLGEPCHHRAGAGRGSISSSQPQSTKSSGSISGMIRLSYVQSDTNNCALITVWSSGRDHYFQHTGKSPASLSPSSSQQQYAKERYLPPDTKSIIEASIHEETGSCAILATPLVLEHSSSDGYILSMVALPIMPPAGPANLSAPSKQQKQPRHDVHALKWQKNLSSHHWQLFSSSETYPIVSFNSQGTHVVFGSTERWGVIDAETGRQLWSLYGTSSIRRCYGIFASSLRTRRLPETSFASAATLTSSANQTFKQNSIINAYLFHREFLFLLQNNGTLLRVYDVSDTRSHKPLAEGTLPWSSVKTPTEKWAEGLVCPHHTPDQHRHLLRKEFQLEFCAGRIWITGMYNSDLLCSSPSRLLRRLRSRLVHPDDQTSSSSVLSLQFVRKKTDLAVGTPHPMHVWNNELLYVVDSGSLHCWRPSNSNGGSTQRDGNVGVDRITTIVSSGNSHIEHVHVDGTKIVVCTNDTFRNTTTRGWDASGSVWVIPMDGSQSMNDDAVPSSSSSGLVAGRMQGRDDDPPEKSGLVVRSNRPYSPVLGIYHKRLFPNFFAGDSTNGTNNGNGNPPLYRVSSSSNSNYQVVGNDIISDGRYLLLQCKKGSTKKTVILDLYRRPE